MRSTLFRRVLISTATAAVLIGGSAGVAAASPNQQHPDTANTALPYCGPGYTLVNGICDKDADLTALFYGTPQSLLAHLLAAIGL